MNWQNRIYRTQASLSSRSFMKILSFIFIPRHIIIAGVQRIASGPWPNVLIFGFSKQTIAAVTHRSDDRYHNAVPQQRRHDPEHPEKEIEAKYDTQYRENYFEDLHAKPPVSV